MAKHVKQRFIGTHDGAFHCDEALACYMLKHLPEYADFRIVRTRDPDKLNECHIVVDVGAVYDHGLLRYDHHQREFTHSFNSLFPNKKWTTKLSSAGLIYVYYGRRVLKQLISEIKCENNLADNPADDEELLEQIFDQVYENFLEEIDAVDNGIAATDGTPRYQITSTISKRVAGLIPAWNEPTNDTILYNQFLKAAELVGSELKEKVKFYAFSWLPAHDILRKSLISRYDIHDSGEIIVLENGSAPWKDHIYAIENELNIGKVKYVLYTDNSKKWRIQCVPVRSGSFESRLPFPKAWCGLRDEELSAQTGIDKCIFVHSNGFIGGNETYEGALKMAADSLRLQASQ